jgi:hypothetical protein
LPAQVMGSIGASARTTISLVPPSATEALWRAAGQPKIVWYDCTHYGAALCFGVILNQVVQHFKAE